MKVLAFVIVATIFEAVGDAVMRIALQARYALPGRIAIFALASVLLALYGLFLNLAPVEFATVTGIYLASLFIAFQIVNYIFFRNAIGSRPARRRVHRCWCCDHLLLEIETGEHVSFRLYSAVCSQAACRKIPLRRQE
jgi:hypothetical protein